MAAKGLTVAASVCFYTWLILCLVDYAPVSTIPVPKGAVLGNASDASASSLYHYSTRYGHFTGWTNEIKEGAAVTVNANVDATANEMPPGMGDRIGQNMRVATFGWFFYFLFATCLAYVRNETRIEYGIPGTLAEDFLASAFVYPTVLYQIEEQVTLCEIEEKVTSSEIEEKVTLSGKEDVTL